MNPSRKRNLLLIASVLFYGYWSIPFLFHFLCVIALNYFLYSYFFSAYTKKVVLLLVAINLLNLALFKYLQFLNKVLSDFLLIFGFQDCIHGRNGIISEIVLPLAISFYSFQILAFHLDEYRNELKEKISFYEFFLFIIFFPQLIAGPIMRFKEFTTQFRKKKFISEKGIDVALFFILIGLVKKVIIADSIASIIDPVFERPESYGWKSLVIGVYGFSIQIYCDFAGYSDIARGLGLSLGYKIPPNFKAPYFAISFSEFWTRWHITLSKWLKDYLYIPLGGNRITEKRTIINLFLTMLIGGIWHGANYTFIIWGALHSVYLIIERLFFRKSDFEMPTSKKLFRSILIFHLVSFAWIFFRSSSAGSAFALIQGIYSGGGNLAMEMSSLPILVILFFLLHYFEYFPRSFPFIQKNSGIFIPAFGFIIAFVIIVKSSSSQSFLYFQF